MSVRVPSPRAIGPYHIVDELGRGGMGVVYRARDSRLERDVAVKVLHGASDKDPVRLQRFLTEARAAAGLNHPNILAVHDVAIDADTPYIVSELIDGQTLRQELNRGAMKLPRLLDMAVQVADALVAAHRANLVHRDLKPENVMVTRSGRVKIVDFGLAKPLSSPTEPLDARTETLTAPYMLIGTPAYVSPEQARGGTVDFRSDLFSFGVVLYEMATGHRPFERPSPIETLTAILHDEPAPLCEANRHAPLELQRIVQRCMAKLPDDRYAATLDLLHDLRTVAATATSRETFSPPRHRSRVSAVLIAVAIAGAAFLSGWTVSKRAETATADPSPWRRLTFRQGYVHAARFTADGQTVLYSASWDGRPVETFATTLSGPESRPLDLPPAGLLGVSRTGELALSLACQYIAASGACTGTLARAPLLGGAPRLLSENVRSADWGPDGTLAATSGVDNLNRVEYPIGTVLSDRGNGHIRVSPDGRRVVWSEVESSGSNGIVVRDAGGTRILSSGWTFISGMAWSPDGSAIWVTGVGNGNRDDAVFRVSLDGSFRPVLRAIPRMRVLDASANGRLLIDRSTEASQMRLHSLDQNEKSTDLTWLGDSVLDAMSDDGKLALFTIRAGSFDRNDDPYPIYVRPTDGGPATRLGSGYGLALSPDKRWALIRTRPIDKEPTLVLYPLGPGGSRTLDRGGLDVGRANSTAQFAGPDRILLRARSGSAPWRTYVQSIDGGPPTLLAHEPGVIVSPVSPDRRRFVSQRADGSLWIATVQPGPSEPLPVALAPNERVLQWTEDGQAFYIQTVEPGRLTIARLVPATGKLTVLRRLVSDGLGDFARFGLSGGARISRDGRVIVTSESRRLSDLFLVEGVR